MMLDELNTSWIFAYFGKPEFQPCKAGDSPETSPMLIFQGFESKIPPHPIHRLLCTLYTQRKKNTEDRLPKFSVFGVNTDYG